jgi:phage-related minor tail protein
MGDNYQTVYGVTLLDDLHNYFPRILYNPQQFQTVPDLLLYLQQTTRTRFNLFDNGLRQYASSVQQAQQQQRTYAQAAAHAHGQHTTHTTHATHTTHSTAMDPVSASLLPLLRSLIVPRVVRVPLNTAFSDPVIVHASQELIQAMTTEETLEEDSENNCAICQDTMRQGELVRKITVCSHQFHRSCIDNWLLNSSVLCPTCRHDIREPARAPSNRNTPVLTATAAQTQQVMQTPPSNRSVVLEGEDAIAAELIGSLSFLL